MSKKSMDKHDFTLILTGEIDDDTDLKLFDAGCDDATFGIRCGRPFLMFTRENETRRGAIISAISDVQKAGLDVLRVDEDALVTQADIAKAIGRSRQMVHQYISGARGTGDFPAPSHVSGSVKWSWPEVASWCVKHQLIPENKAADAHAVALINNVLAILSPGNRKAIGKRFGHGRMQLEICFEDARSIDVSVKQK